MQVLCCDWLLEVRAGTWEAAAGAGTNTAPHAQLRAFQRDLHSLRRLTQDLPVCILFISTNSNRIFIKFFFVYFNYQLSFCGYG